MTFDVWKSWRPQVYKNKWGYHANPEAWKKMMKWYAASMCWTGRKDDDVYEMKMQQ